MNALVDRIVANGGRLHAAIKDIPEMKVRVAFAKDPEGNLAELVETMDGDVERVRAVLAAVDPADGAAAGTW